MRGRASASRDARGSPTDGGVYQYQQRDCVGVERDRDAGGCAGCRCPGRCRLSFGRPLINASCPNCTVAPLPRRRGIPIEQDMNDRPVCRHGFSSRAEPRAPAGPPGTWRREQNAGPGRAKRQAKRAAAGTDRGMRAPWRTATKRSRLIKCVLIYQAHAARRANLPHDAKRSLPPGTCPGSGTVPPPAAPGQDCQRRLPRRPCNGARCRPPAGRAGRDSRRPAATTPHATGRGAASGWAGRDGDDASRRYPMQRGKVSRAGGLGGTADAIGDDTPCNGAWCRLRVGPGGRPTPPATTPHATGHGAASGRAGRDGRRPPATTPHATGRGAASGWAGRDGRRRLRRHPMQRGAVPPPGGPGGTADDACDDTPCNGALVPHSGWAGRDGRRRLRRHPMQRGTVPPPGGPGGTAADACDDTPCNGARCRLRVGRAGRPTTPATTPHATGHGAASGWAGRDGRRRLRRHPMQPGTVPPPAGPGGTAADACDDTPCNGERCAPARNRAGWCCRSAPPATSWRRTGCRRQSSAPLLLGPARRRPPLPPGTLVPREAQTPRQPPTADDTRVGSLYLTHPGCRHAIWRLNPED